MSLKTNKSVLSRIRKTKGGTLLVRGKGHRHFNAKESRAKQLRRKRQVGLVLSKKEKQLYQLSK